MKPTNKFVHEILPERYAEDFRFLDSWKMSYPHKKELLWAVRTAIERETGRRIALFKEGNYEENTTGIGSVC